MLSSENAVLLNEIDKYRDTTLALKVLFHLFFVLLFTNVTYSVIVPVCAFYKTLLDWNHNWEMTQFCRIKATQKKKWASLKV